MENNWFKNPGDLDSSFTPSSDNRSAVPNKRDDNLYFQVPGALEKEPDREKDSYFQTAKDLYNENKSKSFNNPEEIKAWLKTIVSGVKKSNYAFGEGLLATGYGQRFVTLERLYKMVENGDNIISAEYFENMNMVLIEFEQFEEFESFKLPNKSR